MRHNGKVTEQRLTHDLLWTLSSLPLASAKLGRSLVLPTVNDDIWFPDAGFWNSACDDARTQLHNPQLRHDLVTRYESERARHRHGSLRLGLYFELLLGYWLEACGRYEVLAFHDPVHDAQGRTRGEADWIVRDRSTGQLEHWECAVKFYLADTSRQGLASFVGPEPRGEDTLEGKLSHMLGHQLRLELPRVGQESVRRVCCLKGRLFVPWIGNLTHSTTWGAFSGAMDQLGRLGLHHSTGMWWGSVSDKGLDPSTPVGYWTTPATWVPFLARSSEEARTAGFLDPGKDLKAHVLPKHLWLAKISETDLGDLTPWHGPDTTGDCDAPLALVLTREGIVGPRGTRAHSYDADTTAEWTRCFFVSLSFGCMEPKGLTSS